jgi:hypothetical protein
VKVGGVASDFATAVPNLKNGGILWFLRLSAVTTLGCIAKHWRNSL